MASTVSQTTMTTTDYSQERLTWLLAEIAELESQMTDTDLSASEQESLLRDWRYLQDELRIVIEKLEEEEDEEEKEDIYDPNNWVDNREGCAQCSGCAYCMDSAAYDGSDEI